VDALEPLGEVWVVAPDREQSAASHSISIHRPLRISRVRERWYAVDGTPADCAYLGINHLMKDNRPALLVSGINHGANLADDVTYSGTVAAAREGYILGVTSISVSLVARRHFDFTCAARFASSLVKAVLENGGGKRMLLNVNVPGAPGAEPKGYRITRLGKRSYGDEVVENVDPRGRKYYWIGGAEFQHENIPGSDCNAVIDEGLISVTPMMLGITDEAAGAELQTWQMDGFQKPGG